MRNERRVSLVVKTDPSLSTFARLDPARLSRPPLRRREKIHGKRERWRRRWRRELSETRNTGQRKLCASQFRRLRSFNLRTRAVCSALNGGRDLVRFILRGELVFGWRMIPATAAAAAIPFLHRDQNKKEKFSPTSFRFEICSKKRKKKKKNLSRRESFQSRSIQRCYDRRQRKK